MARNLPTFRSGSYTEMESMIRHFKLVYDGIRVPAGEAYSFTEGANGELGYYVVSDGGTNPYRVRIRTPSFPHMQMLPLLSRGHLIADLLAILSAWGPCEGCPEDLDGDGVAGFSDLLIVLSNWS